MRRLPHHDGGHHEILVVPQQPHEHIVLEDVIVIHQQRPAWPAVEVVEGPFYDTVAHNGQRPAAGGLPNQLGALRRHERGDACRELRIRRSIARHHADRTRALHQRHPRRIFVMAPFACPYSPSH
jgi:hypothetical protein